MEKNKLNVNKKKIIVIICILALLFSSLLCYIIYKVHIKNSIEVTQLRTNTSLQMMGYFIKTKNGKIIVVDGGNIGDSDNLKQFILQNGGKVDYWFLTHFHTDHTGAISDIIQSTDIDIKNIVCKFCSKEYVEQYENSRIDQFNIINDALTNTRIKDIIIRPKENDIYTIDNIKVKIISVYEDDITNNLGNNTSMVFKIYINNKSILFLGDTGVESSEKLLKYHYSDLKSDYVQMAHHGQNGATRELYEAINPTYCFWPTPNWLWNNDLGGGFNSGPYKTIETRNWMESLNVKKDYIEKDGNITVKIY